MKLVSFRDWLVEWRPECNILRWFHELHETLQRHRRHCWDIVLCQTDVLDIWQVRLFVLLAHNTRHSTSTHRHTDRQTHYDSFTITSLLVSALALLVRHRNCDLQVVGSSPGWTPLHSGLGQATYTCVSLSPCSIMWYWPKRWSLWLRK